MLAPAKRAYDTQLRMLLSAGGVGDWELNLADMSLTASEQTKAHFGRGPGEPLTLADVWEALPRDEQERIRAEQRRVLEAGGDYEAEHRCLLPGGSVRWLEVRALAIRDESGRVARLYGVTRDITERRQAREVAARLAAELETLVDRAPIGIYVVGGDFRIRHVNPAAMPAFRPAPDPVGRDFGEVVRAIWPEPVAAELVRLFRRTLETGESHEFPEFSREQREPGAAVYYEWRVDRIPLPTGDEGGPYGVVCYFRDITDAVLARERIAESEARFRAIADNIAQFAWTADPDGGITWFNQRWYDYTGLAPAESLGWGWVRALRQEDADRIAGLHRRNAEAGRPWEDIAPLRRRDGAYRWFLTRAVPVRGESGRTVQWVGTNTDVTEQRETAAELARHRAHLEDLVAQRTAALEASHQRLRLSERMATIGTLSAGLGHDMGNLLLPVRVSLDLLESAPLPESARADVARIRTSVDYLGRLSKGLRLMAVEPDAASAGETTDMRAWWADALPVLKNALPRRSGVELRAPAEWPAEWGIGRCRAAISGVALMQVLFNLVQNAGEATAEKWGGRRGGFVAVSARHEPVEAGPGAEPGERIVITVQDNGPGMTPEVRARCLEPYFSTKPRDRSMGMGLALVDSLVRNAGGLLAIRSTPGEGAAFEVSVPCVAAVTARAAATPSPARPPARGEAP